jgi:hypothetical protein
MHGRPTATMRCVTVSRYRSGENLSICSMMARSNGEQGRCSLGRLTGSPLASAGRRHSRLIPGSRTHDRPPERPGFFPSRSCARRRFRPEACQTSDRALRTNIAVSGGSLGGHPSVEHTCLQDSNKHQCCTTLLENALSVIFVGFFCLTGGARVVEWARISRRPRSDIPISAQAIRRERLRVDLPLQRGRSVFTFSIDYRHLSVDNGACGFLWSLLTWNHRSCRCGCA